MILFIFLTIVKPDGKWLVRQFTILNATLFKIFKWCADGKWLGRSPADIGCQGRHAQEFPVEWSANHGRNVRLLGAGQRWSVGLVASVFILEFDKFSWIARFHLKVIVIGCCCWKKFSGYVMLIGYGYIAFWTNKKSILIIACTTFFVFTSLLFKVG